MKVVILAGGFGSRLSEETDYIPKPMVKIGERPILWHIMKTYSQYGYNDFIICCGYKGHVIKEYFSNYFLHSSDITIDMSKKAISYSNNKSEPWKINLIDTGLHTETGGRLKRLFKYLKDEQTFMLTYGDGISDINISKLIEFHNSHGKLATVTAVNPPSRFGALEIDATQSVKRFTEKPILQNNYINGGYFVLNTKVLEIISGDTSVFENEPLWELTKSNELKAYKYNGFWHPMDTLRDKRYLERLWDTGDAPWKIRDFDV